jgi:putative flavoprotein involved in K+ transport
MAGRDVGDVPFRMESLVAKAFLARFVLRFVFHRILTIRNPLGRRARPTFTSKGGVRIRVKGQDLDRLEVKRVPRLAGVANGRPQLADGTVLDVANIVWCTGYHPGFSWIDLPVLGDDGEPVHDGGVVSSQPGLYFLGLHFLYAVSSTMIHGVGRDARRIAGAIRHHARTRLSATRVD